MRTPCAASLAFLAATAALVGVVLGTGRTADPAPAAPPPTPAPLVVHEWGTFTCFSGSDGVAVGFTPDNTDLPDFVYSQTGPRNTKAVRLRQDGTVSMETPVVYFYADRETKASVKVDFPQGWITEWYPAAAPPAPTDKRTPGQSMRWDVRLLPGESVTFPGDPKAKYHYYRARETDAAPVEARVAGADKNGGTVVQHERFLFYRGVGTFPTPVAVKAPGGGNVRVTNALGRRVDGLVLVTVRGGKVGFRVLGALDTGAGITARLPAADGSTADVADVMAKYLTRAGLYEKEARAMVKTWDRAWFGEDGTRLLYLVPRSRADELLPLTVSPKPTEVVRVLVGRHDFLTPEQEADIDRQVRRIRAQEVDTNTGEAEVRRVGRFWLQAMALAEKRLDTARR